MRVRGKEGSGKCLCLSADPGISYVTLSQVVVVSDYVSVRIIIPRERVNSDGFSLQSVWQCFGEC